MKSVIFNLASACAPLDADALPACASGSPDGHAAGVGEMSWYQHLGLQKFDFFTNFGNYMPRTHCLTNAQGEVDWPWVIGLMLLTGGVIGAYLRIFRFWRRSYLEEQAPDRNRKLMDLAWVFLWCAICGYAMNMVMYVWPAYRLLACFLVVLNIFSWRFAANLKDFKVSFAVKRLQRELEESRANRVIELEREVAKRTAELEQARLVAETASEAKSAFLANMSHEIRTPMSAILGYADMLSDPDAAGTPEQRADLVSTIRRNGDHLLAIINDILDISKIEAGQMRVEHLGVDPAAVLDDVIALMKVRADAKRLGLGWSSITPIPATVRTDPLRLRQILTNLVGNAIKFTQTGGVHITMALEGGPTSGESVLSFSVQDTGIGMTPDQLDRLFRPFAQADDSSTRRFGGTGLGLCISKRLAEMLGGGVRLTSVSGQGTCARAWIGAGPVDERGMRQPAQLGPSAQPLALRPDDRSDGAPLPSISGARILLVEDGVDNQRLVCHLLTRAGAVVETADNGRVALHRLFDGRLQDRPAYDIILMDMQMPVLDGYQATFEMRRRGCCVPIVALTAHTICGDRERCLEAGCTDYLSKPIRKGALISMCAAWIGQTHAVAAAAAAA